MKHAERHPPLLPTTRPLATGDAADGAETALGRIGDSDDAVTVTAVSKVGGWGRGETMQEECARAAESCKRASEWCKRVVDEDCDRS
jgi:hypothetical protein